MSEVSIDDLVLIARSVLSQGAPDAHVRMGKISESPSARVEWDTDTAISTLLFWQAGKTFSEVLDVEEDATTLRSLRETFATPEEFRAVVESHVAFVAAA